MKELAACLDKIIRRRDKLKYTNAVRLVNGAGDGMDGLLIDRYNKHLNVQILNDRWQKQLTAIRGFLVSAMPVEYLVVKSRRGLDIRTEVLAGTDPCSIVEEHGVKFEVNLNDGLNCGLFLDMRHNRRMVAQTCKDKKVLNGFAYTCSFGLHARLEGAREVINTDISRKTLERGKNNYQLNGLSFTAGEFIKTDSISFLQRAIKKGNSFDVIILDPPSFSRHEAGVFQVKRDLPKALALSVAVLNPKGRLLVSTNYSEISHAGLERMLADGIKTAAVDKYSRRVKHIDRVGQDMDFVGTNSFKESYLVGLWVEFL